jgi:predicted nucleic acid-binding protein
MNQRTQNSAGAVVIDANVLISICSNEPSEATARAALADYTARNWAFYAPSVIVTEVLFALCRKLQDGSLSAASHKQAVEDFNGSYLPAISPPPNGDAALLLRAEEIRSGYSCLHSADGFYLALAEELTLSGTAEFLTFDKRVVNVAANNAPSVKVNLLPS